MQMPTQLTETRQRFEHSVMQSDSDENKAIVHSYSSKHQFLVLVSQLSLTETFCRIYLHMHERLHE